MSLQSVLRIACIVALVLTATPVAAQTVGVAIAPVVGYYRPFGDFRPASVYSTALPEHPKDLQAASWGARAQLSFPNRIGIAIELLVTNSQVPEVITPAGPRGPTGARVTVGAIQAQIDVSPHPRAYHFWLDAGPAIVHHGGDAYASLSATSAVAGAAGGTLVIPLARHLQVLATGEVLFYQMNIPMPSDLRLNPGSLERGTQRDALVHVGLAYSSF